MDVADAIDRARRLQDEDKADEALDLLLRTAREHPCEDLDLELASFYTDRGMRRSGEEALADFAEAKTWFELPLTLAAEASERIARKEFDAAEMLLGRALEMDPELPLALYGQGCLRLEQGRFGEAVEPLTQAIDLVPTVGDGYKAAARALEGAGRKEEALNALLTGVAKCPRDDGLFVRLGWACAERNDFPRACEAWRRAAELNHASAEAWRGVAWGAARQDDELRMNEALDRAMELDPGGTKTWLEKERAALPLLNRYPK